MVNSQIRIPIPANEPIRSYAPGSAETESLKKTLAELAACKLDIPAVIGGQRIRTGRLQKSVMPHAHQRVLAEHHQCGKAEVKQAIKAAEAAWPAWNALAWQDRAAIFLKAADSAGRALARSYQCLDHAGSKQDSLSSGD